MTVKQAMHSIFNTTSKDATENEKSTEIAQTTSTTVGSIKEPLDAQKEMKSLAAGIDNSSEDEDIDLDKVKNRTVERIKANHCKRVNKYKLIYPSDSASNMLYRRFLDQAKEFYEQFTGSYTKRHTNQLVVSDACLS